MKWCLYRHELPCGCSIAVKQQVALWRIMIMEEVDLRSLCKNNLCFFLA